MALPIRQSLRVVTGAPAAVLASVLAAVVATVLMTPSAAYAADRTPPTVPQALRVTGVTDSAVSLAWAAATDWSGRVSYRIYVDGAQRGAPSQTAHTVSGLGAGTAFTFTVRAEDRYGNLSAASAAVSGTTISAPSGGVGTPADLHVTGAGYDSVSLAWEPATGAVAYYQILRNGQWVDSAYGTTATLRYLSPGTAYTIEVRARDTWNNVSTPVAIVASTRADTQPPSTPANLRVVAAAPGAPASFQWDTSTDDRGVGIYWLFADGDPVFGGTPGVSFSTLTDVLCTVFSGETYTFTVRAQDLSGRLSDASSSVRITVP